MQPPVGVNSYGADLYVALCDVLEWAKGNRGSKEGNPYGIREIADALKLLAKIQHGPGVGKHAWLDADTKI